MRWRRGVLLAVAGSVVLAGTASGAPSPTRVHFTAVGDYSASPTAGAVLSALAARGSDAHLALGDLSYGVTGEEEAWCDFVKARVGDAFPFELLAGNHESNGINGNINDFSACLPNQLPGLVGTYGRQYFVDVPQVDPLVRFVMLSPNLGFPGGQWNYSAGSARYAWTSDAIDGARTAGIPWVVVGAHKPCLSLGQYSCEIGSDLLNLMVSKKVDIVLSGHEHLYQRTKQLAQGAGCSTLTIGTYNANCVVDNDNDLVKGAGTVFATIGTGGTALRDVNSSDPEAGYFAATSGSNQNGTYGFGDFDVTPDRMIMEFVRGAGGTFTDLVTWTKDTTPPVNQPPTAAFTSSSAGLVASFDGRVSTDSDGSISTWAWTYGDGTAGSGSTAQHTYPAAGTYVVTLTVTDNQGATATTTKDTTVSLPSGPLVLARDDFERAVSSGWGTADLGGAWTLAGGSTNFTVAAGAGRTRLTAGASLTADLAGSVTQNSRTVVEFSVDKLADANYVSILGRRVGSDYYVARLRMQADGAAKLYLLRGTGNSVGASVYAPTIAFLPGEKYRLGMLVKGVSPTTISASVWKASDPEPSVWQRTTTDSFAAMQTAGRAGLLTYLPTAAPNAPVTVSFHSFMVEDAS